MNDIGRVLDCKLHKFADDIKLSEWLGLEE